MRKERIAYVKTVTVPWLFKVDYLIPFSTLWKSLQPREVVHQKVSKAYLFMMIVKHSRGNKCRL